MNTRVLVPFLCAGAIAFACAPRPAASDAATPPAPATATMPAAGRPKPGAAPVLVSSLDVSVGAEQLRFTMHVTNNSDERVELTFPSGQTHDFTVLDESGREVWRWSADRMFTQALQTRVLEPHGTATFTADAEGAWTTTGGAKKFVVVGRLSSAAHPLETRVEFTAR